MALRTPVSEQDHYCGPATAPVELVEYGDYQCPHCGRAYPVIKALMAALGDNLKFVFRNFPLSKIHPHARLAAIATEAAALQGRYWDMYNMLFQNQKRIHQSALAEYAAALGLDVEQFKKDMRSSELEEKVESHFYSGMRSGVNATPTFFINGEQYTGSWEDDELLAFIRSCHPGI